MTEIVNNNNGMAFDLLETGNSANVNLSDRKFNSFFSDIEKNKNSGFEAEEIISDRRPSFDDTMDEIIKIIKDSGLNIDKDVLSDIAAQLKNFFAIFNSVETNNVNFNTSNRSHIDNGDFLHLMRFLEKMKEMLSVNTNADKSRDDEINRVLDQIRTKLNQQIKTLSRSKLVVATENRNSILQTQEGSGNQSAIDKSENAKLTKSNTLNQSELLTNGTNTKKQANLELIQVKLRDDNSKNKMKAKPLKKSINLEKDLDNNSNVMNKMVGNKSEVLAQQTPNTSFSGKDIIAENNLLKQNINPTVKLDINNANVQQKNQGALSFNNETNNRLLDNLNMLSKTWGSELIEKIEMSMVDGVEKLEIALTPKSLGKLNVIINMQDSIAKINIVAESSSVAALLAESEAKLSQMMEANGLKLASLQTLTQQFGQNKREKEHSQKLTLSKKKDNMNETGNIGEKINNEESQKEGLNLIA